MANKLGRGQPWPYDCSIGGTPMMLTTGPRKESPWTESKVRYFEAGTVMTAEDRSYQMFPPEVDLPQAQETWGGGYGQGVQDRKHRDMYSHALFADCSTGKPTNGPAMNLQVSTLAGGFGSNMITFTIAGVETLMYAAGTNLYKRTDDTPTGWTLVYAAGVTIGQMAVFRGTQANDRLFVPLGSATNYLTVDSAGVTALHASQKANGFIVAGDELYLYVLATNQWILKKCFDGGPTPTWIGNYPVGDSRDAVTDAHIAAQRLILGKTNGLYGVSALVSPLAEDITPSLHESRGKTNNCSGSVVFGENYIFKYDGGALRYDPSSGQLEQFGPEVLVENKSEVRGTVEALASQDGIAVYAFLFNSSNSTSYMCKWGTWDVESSEGRSLRTPKPSWHGSLYQWTSRQVCFAQLVTLDWGTGAGRIPRIYIGMTNGDLHWFYPARTTNPADDPNYRYNTTNQGEVYQSRYTANFPFEFKVLKNVGVVGHNQTGVRPIGANYKIPSAVTYESIGTVSAEPGDKLSPGGTPTDKAFDFKLTLNASTTVTPVIDAFVIYAAIRFENLKEIVAWVNVSDDIILRDGRTVRQRWQDVRDRLETVANASGSVTVISPSGETLTCLAIEFSHAVLIEDTEKKIYVWKSMIKLVQTRAEATRGTWNRVGPPLPLPPGPYTWDNLSAYHWSELATL